MFDNGTLLDFLCGIKKEILIRKYLIGKTV